MVEYPWRNQWCFGRRSKGMTLWFVIAIEIIGKKEDLQYWSFEIHYSHKKLDAENVFVLLFACYDYLSWQSIWATLMISWHRWLYMVMKTFDQQTNMCAISSTKWKQNSKQQQQKGKLKCACLYHIRYIISNLIFWNLQ